MLHSVYDSVDYILNVYHENYYTAQLIPDESIEKAAISMLFYGRLIKLTRRQSEIVGEYEMLFKELIVNV